MLYLHTKKYIYTNSILSTKQIVEKLQMPISACYISLVYTKIKNYYNSLPLLANN